MPRRKANRQNLPDTMTQQTVREAAVNLATRREIRRFWGALSAATIMYEILCILAEKIYSEAKRKKDWVTFWYYSTARYGF